MDNKTTIAVWVHFEEQKDTGTVKCNLCRKPFVYRCGSTSNLKKHLKAKHTGTLLSLGRYMNFTHSCASESQKKSENIDFVIFIE